MFVNLPTYNTLAEAKDVLEAKRIREAQGEKVAPVKPNTSIAFGAVGDIVVRDEDDGCSAILVGGRWLYITVERAAFLGSLSGLLEQIQRRQNLTAGLAGLNGKAFG